MVLNPALLYAVQRRIGPCRVINENLELVGLYQDDIRRGRVGLKVIKWGETYLTDCPYCNDHRQRMSISYRYGVPDHEVSNRGTQLWKCYNEECQNNPEKREKLRWSLLPEIDLPTGGPRLRPPSMIKAASSELEPIEFPGIMIPLLDLPRDHKAVQYLVQRRYDIRELSTKWEVGYAETMPARREGAMAQDRIIIPVRQKGVLVGWQARFVGDLDWHLAGIPKYLTYFPKSMALYGLDEALRDDAEIIVLVEGVTDVWRYGSGAVCGFGKKFSPDQIRLILQLCGYPYKPLVMVPDANDKDAFDNFCRSMGDILDAGYRGAYGLAPLPRGKDPGSMSRASLRALVQTASACALENHNRSNAGTSSTVP